MAESARDAKYFVREKPADLKAELTDDRKDKGWARRKAALKKIVANMTMGADMSSLFAPVAACMTIQVLDIKKMVYLYLLHYARPRQELAHTTIPAFLSDCHDRNPLIRALAIRTMAALQVPVITDALLEPLQSSLRDADPYVRKTAAIAVAKVYMADRQLADKHHLIARLRDLLADANATVVANAVAALTEISERSDNIQLKLNLTVASKLVSALPETSEWGQVYILEALLFFVPTDVADAEILAERVAVRLSSSNSAVVLTSAKVILYLMNYISSAEVKETLARKMSPPLMTLLSSGPEVQYVALRNILLIIQRRPLVLRNEVRIFFCKYNDPIYVKMAKLEIMYRLTAESNIRQVLAELHEYATEVDVDFVRKAVRSIGRLAIKIPAGADACVHTLLQLVDTGVSYVVQEAVVVLKDIFRKYPNQYEGAIPNLCAHLDMLDQVEAKVAMVWILGEYADRIENADELLEDFLFGFLDEPSEVQLALLTATVKLFLKRPAVASEIVPKLLKAATEEVENPDVRDRGFMYWRMLSTDPSAAKGIVLAPKPSINTETDRMDRGLLDQLLLHGATLGSIFHRPPQTFIRGARARYLPDSPALDEAARKTASTHLYSKPAAPRLETSSSHKERERDATSSVNASSFAHSGTPNTATTGLVPVEDDTPPRADPDASAESVSNAHPSAAPATTKVETDPYAMLGDLA